MALFFVLVIVHVLCIDYCSTLSGFNLYHTHHRLNIIDRDCLYYFIPKINAAYQFVEYCVRFPLDDEVFDNMDNDNQYTFEDLRQKNITSDQLYNWSVPIDLIEDYQNYLETNTSTNNSLVYNCTFPWFGSRCEYSFDESEPHFDNQIKLIFLKKGTYDSRDLIIPPCYTHLQCDRVGDGGQAPGACLDWREVCDGKVDCIDGGEDEQPCWQLELNECDEKTEFRCHNGLCIPLAFLSDDDRNADCFDRSDEPFPMNEVTRCVAGWSRFREGCYEDPAFRCEDERCHSSIHKQYIFECGDGSCATIYNVCMNKRSSKLLEGLWFGTNILDDCRLSITCFTRLHKREFFDDHCTSSASTYVKNIARYCPPIMVLPPILFGHVRFVYTNNQTQKIHSSIMKNFILPDYICYDGNLCDSRLFSISWSPYIDFFGNNSTCRSFNESVFNDATFFDWTDVLNSFYNLFRKCSNYHQPSSMLNNSNLYQCINSSKIISQHRLLDGIEDCLYGDDETYRESCSLKNFNHRFRCDPDNNTKCVARLCVFDDYGDCLDKSDEELYLRNDLERTISFQTMCDGYPELPGRNEADETECEYFPCNNIYTRCDRFWNCPNGVDEVNCEWPPICPPLHHMCLSPLFGNLTCLHIRHVNDGIIDCLGASDERKFCRETMKNLSAIRYRCWNSDKCIGSAVVCAPPPPPLPQPCPMNNNNSMHFCPDVHNVKPIDCVTKNNLTHIEQLLCTINDDRRINTVHFSIIGSTSYSPKQIQATTQTAIVLANNEMNDELAIDYFNTTWHCNRGLIVHRRSAHDKNNAPIICFCPPAYYGHLCQYQNQRVSLTMQVRASFDFQIQFAIVITLRDDQQNLIESYEQVNFLYERDCRKKFNIYLLYATRPKNTSTNHNIHIDIFNKETFQHRASWLFPIKFPFLPVYRMAIQIQIPPTKIIIQNCDTFNCRNHGHCSQYENTKTLFCICDKGWSGTFCDIPYTSHCSSDSFSFAPYICVCPLQKFGPRCYLKRPVCTCENNGTCISDDERIGEDKEQWCICRKGYSGSRCELVDMTLTLSFAPEIPIPQNILVHFIGVSGKTAPHNRSTIPIKIPLDQEIVSIFRSIPFHIVFVEIIKPKTYYLSVFQQEFVPSMNITSTIKYPDRCLSINELFNETIVKWHPIRRMKYYHIPCQQRSNLTCFYDDMHMCICSSDLRQANCMTFDHSMHYECEEEHPCANGGRCFRDNPTCPTSFMCECDECSYGSQCQVSTRGFGLSLDIILGYHIQQYQSFSQQHSVIHVTTGIVTVMLILGLVSNLLSILTFRSKKAREVGCGYYLLVSSYISLITIIIFALKFYFLLVSQMALITNRSYLEFNCIVFELLLKVLLSSGDWLNSFVGIERAITVIKTTKFNKMISKRVAKWMIICICIVTTTTHIHDPIYRRMIDDTFDQRSWCHVKFSSSIELYNSIILVIHFGVPFLLNIISALVIIIVTARQRAIAQKQQTYQDQLRKQLKELKHLLISPVILIVLASPRLAISFLSGCIKTTRGNPWFYLSGYLISFLPSMLIMIVFVVPSKIYQHELKKTWTRLQKYIRRDYF